MDIFLNFILFFNSFFTVYIPFPAPTPIHHLTSPHPTHPPHPTLSPWGYPHPPPHLTSKLSGASSRLRIKCIISEWTQTQKSSTVYVLGASYQLVYAVCLVVQCLRDLGVQINWDCWSSYRITLLLSFFQPSLIQQQESAASVHWLGANICIWLFQLFLGLLEGIHARPLFVSAPWPQ